MTKDLRCSNCQSPIDPAKVDRQRELASCSNCGRLMDLRQTPAAPREEPDRCGKPRVRAPVQLPDGISITTSATGAEVVIRRRWLRAKHWLMMAVFALASAYVAHLWSTVGASWWVIIATLFVLSWNYNLAAMFINGTVVTADATAVNVRHGPLPTVFARNAAVKQSDVEQLYSDNFGAQFAVQAKLKSGQTLRLVAPLIGAEQALFVEQQLERTLRLVDFAVEGELNDAVSVQGKRPAGAAAGTALVFLIPVFIASMVALFVVVLNTEVSGRLQANGALGSWVFEPDDCSSGQHEGFGGVVLKASKQPGRVIRIVKDPVRGSLVVVVPQGQPTQVLDGKSCARFAANAERTNTNINEIWVVDGSLTLECSELSGSVIFEGCH